MSVAVTGLVPSDAMLACGVFVCHAGSTQWATARAIHAQLANAGIVPFVDVLSFAPSVHALRLSTGAGAAAERAAASPMQGELSQHIRLSQAAVVVLDAAFFDSAWCRLELECVRELRLRNAAYPLVVLFDANCAAAQAARNELQAPCTWPIALAEPDAVALAVAVLLERVPPMSFRCRVVGCGLAARAVPEFVWQDGWQCKVTLQCTAPDDATPHVTLLGVWNSLDAVAQATKDCERVPFSLPRLATCNSERFRRLTCAPEPQPLLAVQEPVTLGAALGALLAASATGELQRVTEHAAALSQPIAKLAQRIAEMKDSGGVGDLGTALVRLRDEFAPDLPLTRMLLYAVPPHAVPFAALLNERQILELLKNVPIGNALERVSQFLPATVSTALATLKFHNALVTRFERDFVVLAAPQDECAAQLGALLEGAGYSVEVTAEAAACRRGRCLVIVASKWLPDLSAAALGVDGGDSYQLVVPVFGETASIKQQRLKEGLRWLKAYSGVDFQCKEHESETAAAFVDRALQFIHRLTDMDLCSGVSVWTNRVFRCATCGQRLMHAVDVLSSVQRLEWRVALKCQQADHGIHVVSAKTNERLREAVKAHFDSLRALAQQ